MKKILFAALFILPSISFAGNLFCQKEKEEMMGESQKCYYKGGLQDAITAFSKYAAQWNEKKKESIPYLWKPILKDGIPTKTATMALPPKSRFPVPFSETEDYPLETVVASIEWKSTNKVTISGCVYETDGCLSATFIQKEEKVLIEAYYS